MKATTPEPDDERAVSLRVSAAVPESPPTLREIQSAIWAFQLRGARDDRLILNVVPSYVRRALETLVAGDDGPPISSAALLVLHVGLDRLADLAEIQTVCTARAELLRRGSAAIGQLDKWDYTVAARHGSPTRMFLRSVVPSDLGRCAELGAGVGLTAPCLGVVAVMAGLIGTPLPGDLPRDLLAELREFYRGLRQRALLAEELRARARAMPQTEQSRVSWATVLNGQGE